MKTPATNTAALFAMALGVSFNTVHADTFGSGAFQFTIDFVDVGDPGNANDSGTTGLYFSPLGGVAYEFRMGKYEISEDMINKANAEGGLDITRDRYSRVNQPAVGVSWNEAARFVNWLNTSQGYSVAYKFTLNPGDAGYSGNTDLVLWTPGDAGYDAANLYRNSDAHYFLPSEDEWYKAAFYSGIGTTYYDYATESDTIPTPVASGTAPGTAVYGGGTLNEPADITQAGGLSHYGTMGQDGNVVEWQETSTDGLNDLASMYRGARGGAYNYADELYLRSSVRQFNRPYDGSNVWGFRVASVPEPSTTVLIIGSGLMLLARRRRASFPL